MTDQNIFDVIIIGGSYSGLSAAMTLGRALRKVLIIDSGKPCNIQTPHAHNFITQDGKTPLEIATLAKKQVLNYQTIMFYDGLAISGKKVERGFEITTQTGENFTAKKLIFATGVKDLMANIKGFSECWEISVIHCPYCHGYEYRSEKTGILANGDVAFETVKMINNWTKNLTLFTNGRSTLTAEQTEKIKSHNINIIETEILGLEHQNGKLNRIVMKDQSTFELTALYAKPAFEQHCKIPEQLGCELTEQNYLATDVFQKTSQDGIFACGDNTTPMRSLSSAVATGGMAGAMASRALITEEF